MLGKYLPLPPLPPLPPLLVLIHHFKIDRPLVAYLSLLAK